MSNWQPIDTAPKDGTQILLHLADGQCICAEWCVLEGDVAGWETWHYPDGTITFLAQRATHWMPLPEPPQ